MRGTRLRLVALTITLFATLFGLLAAPPPGVPAGAASAEPPAAGTPLEQVAAPRRTYPTVEVARARRASRAPNAAVPATAASKLQPPLTYHGGVDGIGVTTGPPRVFVVFWGSQWGSANPPGSTNFSNDSLGVANRVLALMNGLGTNNERWSGVATQYCEGVPVRTDLCPASAPHVAYPTGGTLAGLWSDTATPTPTSATATDLGAEAVRAAGHFGNTTPESNRNVQYVVVSPKGTHPDGFNQGGGFCAWHGYNGDAWIGAPSSYGDIAFTNLPYIPDMGKSCGANFVNPGSAGLLDGVTMVEGHEFSETITDQNPAGGWWDANGEENADKCAWLPDGQGAARNVAFATGSFAMQSTWSNDGEVCLMSHPIWGIPGLPDSFALRTSPTSGFAMPGDSVSSTVQAITPTGNPQAVALSVTGVPPNTAVSFASSSISSDESTTMTIATTAATPLGEYAITVTATGGQVQSATYSLSVDDSIPTLQNGIAVTNLAGAVNSERYYQVDVPTGMTIADFSIGGGSGDADIYIRRDALPDSNTYTCGSWGTRTDDSCQIYGTNSAGHWYVGVFGAGGYSDVSLQVTYAVGMSLSDKQTLSDLSGAAGSARFWWINVPSKRSRLTVSIAKAKGDADLYVRLYGLPTPFANLCSKVKRGQHGETCTVNKPWNGTYWVGVYGYTDFSKLRLVAKY